MTRRRRTWWLVGFLLVSLFVAILLTVKERETLFTGPEYAAFREACARAPASQIPFWTGAGINCRIMTSNIWLLLLNWSVALAFLAGVVVLAGSVWLLARHGYRMAQVGAVPDAPWFWRDTVGFGLGLVPFGLAVGVVEMRMFSALQALPVGMAGSFLFAWLLARLRSRRMFTLPPAAAVAAAPAPARESVRPEPARGHSRSTALCRLPFTPVRSTIPIPPGLLLVKDEDGPPAPLWERLIGSGTERQLGPAKELRLDYGFELSYPVTVLEYLLCCWHGGAESVGQLGGSRSHHLRDFTFAHLVRLIFDWPLYQLGRYRLRRALLPYYRSGCSLNRNRWIFANATLQEDSYRREQALREVQAEHPCLNRPVGNVDWFNSYRYCCWLSAETGSRCRLPTEIEFLRAFYYLEHERGRELLPVFGRRWYWTSDWYALLPSYSAGRTVGHLYRVSHQPFHTLKSVHINPYERGAVVPWYRAINHGLVYVCGDDREANRTPDGFPDAKRAAFSL